MPQAVYNTSTMESNIRRALRHLVDVSVDDLEIRRAPTKHYIYVIYVSWSDGTVSIVYRRYEDFLLLEKIISRTVRKNRIACNDINIQQLPGKILLGRNNVQKVAFKRQGLLYDYCKVLLSLPRVILDASHAALFFEPTDLDIRSTLKRPVMDEKSRGNKVNEISSPILEEKYIAISDYNKTGDDQLDLKAGDSLQAFIRDESGWWLVLNTDGKHGWAPCSYLEKVDGTEEETTIKMPAGKAEKYMILADYDAQYSDEVSLEKGAVIEVLEKTLDGWWLVRTANKEGRAPSTNLAKADSLKVRQALDKATLPDGTINFQEISLDSPMHDDFSPRLSMFELDMDKDKDDYVDVWDDQGLHKMIQEGPKQGGSQHGSARKNVKEILSLKRKTSDPPPRKRSINRKIASIKDADKGLSPDQAASTSSRSSVPSPPCAQDEDDVSLEDPADSHIDPSDQHDYYNVSPFQKKQSKKERPRFEARSMFKAGDAGETDLTEGEIVPVLERTGTGWWMVESSAGVGWVPSHFLKPLKGLAQSGVREKYLSEQEMTMDALKPKVPGHKKENIKAEGHIANRYLQGSVGLSQQDQSKHRGSPQQSPKTKRPETMPKPPKNMPGSPKSISTKTESTKTKPVQPPPGMPKPSYTQPKGGRLDSPKSNRPMPSKKPTGSARKPSSDSQEETYPTMGVQDLRAKFNR